MQPRLVLIIASFVFFHLYFKAQVKVGEWKDHLSYNSCNTVAKVGNIIYASNTTGIIKYNKDDGSIERLPRKPKSDVANAILDRVVRLSSARHA